MNQITRQTVSSGHAFSIRNLILSSALALTCSITFGQAQNNGSTVGTGGVGVTDVAVTRCDKPIAKVVMGELTCKASDYNNAGAGIANPLLALLEATGHQPNASGIGDGIKDMVTTALQQTGCFEVIDRDAKNEIKKELEAVGQTVAVEVADFLVAGTVTQGDMEKTSAISP